MIVCFVDIGGIVDHHCLSFLFIVQYRCDVISGDGAGVGKGRTVAGLIYENYLLGRKRALW